MLQKTEQQNRRNIRHKPGPGTCRLRRSRHRICRLTRHSAAHQGNADNRLPTAGSNHVVLVASIAWPQSTFGKTYVSRPVGVGSSAHRPPVTCGPQRLQLAGPPAQVAGTLGMGDQTVGPDGHAVAGAARVEVEGSYRP
jgi:hypothetical protein